MSSDTADVNHLVLGGGVGRGESIGDVEVNEWSELLTNEQEIAVAHPVSFPHQHKKMDGKFKNGEPSMPHWHNQNNHMLIEKKQAPAPPRKNEYYSHNGNGFRKQSSIMAQQIEVKPSPPSLPPKTLSTSNNSYSLNGVGQMNNHLNNQIETIFIPTKQSLSHISSSLVKEVAELNGDISQLVPKLVLDKLVEKKNIP